jgi:osmotically-inducible protein OsmY
MTLLGTVGWEYQKAAVMEAVKSLYGLRSISNQIEVAPAASAICVVPRVDSAAKTALS